MDALAIDRTVETARAGSTSFVANASREWMDHWWSLPRDGIVPVRSAFDPLAVPKLLPHMLICDLTEPGVVRIRLMGTEMASNFGFDPTGRDYLDLVAPERREAAYQGFVVPASRPCGMRVLGENQYFNGGPIAVETVGLPFRRDDGDGMQMVFVGSRLGPSHDRWRDRGPTKSFHVFEREFIDIGAGVP
jgi:hypothetical protein